MKGFIKKIIANKRGIAIELALLVMIIVVSLTALVVSISVFNRNTTDKLSQDIKDRTQLDQIGQSYVLAVKQSADLEVWKQNIQGYTAQVSNLQLALVDSQGNVKLSVKLENYQNGYKITEWKYS